MPYTSPAYSSFFFAIIDVRAFADPEARTLRQDRDASSIPVVIDSVCFALAARLLLNCSISFAGNLTQPQDNQSPDSSLKYVPSKLTFISKELCKLRGIFHRERHL